MFKVNNKDTKTMPNMFIVNNNDTRTKLTLTIYWRRSGVFIVNFEHISHFVSIVAF